ncbi:long-chain-fatty-acid--CoA ligase [Mycobacterium sp. CVI_P3]|uniref:Long-chain-fatty-acid--CoA ligase n=1 Tax=Mycobacterium pinniadriaticum TaxID=2994102 RepID=A0ABT3SEI1_9MYCO|nr:long-chain-fatty-acid--CoA ligase [Mycobacterium pinniadriaticum]MCX2931233.1 long-chain-fatty-acid--CoA ligase [Mycobacterium pinniadriaticum]MCX2937543.1 long-chain-fatty-acid--CoA ligase [Mycobacterium pinniadriaticum]
MTAGMYLTQGLHRSSRATGDDTMTICGDRVHTFTDVADRVSRLAGAFQSLGVHEGDRIAILSLNSDRYSEYLLATPWAGAVVNPINIRLRAAEIAYSLRDSDTRILLIDDTFLPLLPELLSQFSDLATVIHCGDGPTPAGTLGYEELVATSAPVPDAHRSGSDLAGVFYTGGTSGHPKGVMLTHDNLMTSALGCLASGFFLTSGGPLLHAAPMFHLADLAIWLAQVIHGGTHVFIPAFRPDLVLGAVQQHRVSDLLLVPTMVQMLVDEPTLPDYDTSSLRMVIYGGSPISAALLERAAQRLPTASFVQAYGMTEVSPVATLLSPADHHNPALRRSGGRAAPHSEVRIVGDDDTELARGEVGEIVVRGGHVMAGYWGKPEETAAALRGGWMHTGDAGYQDDRGYVFVVDRIKDMIVSGGENVYSVEVENALARHPAVATCAVIGVPDERWGERVHAVVVLAAGQRAEHDELREFCKSLIGGYKIPRSFELVDALPLSAAGKVLKRELRAKYWAAADRAVG